jgi:hypothetical protein
MSLDRLAVVHRPVAVGHTLDVRDAVEDPPWFDPALEDVGQQVLDVRTDGCGAARHTRVFPERDARGGRVVLGHANSTNGAAGPHDPKGCLDSLLKPDAFQD